MEKVVSGLKEINLLLLTNLLVASLYFLIQPISMCIGVLEENNKTIRELTDSVQC